MNSMNETRFDDQHSLNTQDLLKLEEICSGFEANWSSDSYLAIAGLVIEADSHLQSNLASELVCVDLEMRAASNQSINPEEYLARLPGFSESLKVTLAKFDPFFDNPHLNSGESPRRIGDYRIVRQIGEGGAGIVFEGVQESLGRRVAIKMLSQGYINSQVSRFRREAKAIAKLHHTNIVEVFGSGIYNGTPYFAMQLIDGQNLAEVIDAAKQGNSDHVGVGAEKKVARIGLQVARALEHAHRLGVLHRDIKPSNLLLDANETTWVTDFGLAKLVDDQSAHAKTQGLVGTIRYVPPEGFSGTWDERSDVYSLGLTLYELLVLKPAFVGNDYRQLIKNISNEPFSRRQLREIGGVSKDLETIILKAVCPEPQGRYSSARDFADELQRYLDDVPIKARPVSFWEKSWRWAKRRPAAAALTLLTTLIFAVGLPVLLWLWLKASSALTVVQTQREEAIQMQQSIVKSRDDAESARYGSTSLLTQSYIDRGLDQEARRTFLELQELISNQNPQSESVANQPWEVAFLKQSLDSSLKTFQGPEEFGVWRVAVRPDDQQIATVHTNKPNDDQRNVDQGPGQVILWDLKTGEKQHVLEHQGSTVWGCCYTSDGNQIATIGLNVQKPGSRGSLCLWDVATGKKKNQTDLPGKYDAVLLTSMYGHPATPGVAFSDDDRLMVTWPNPVEVRDAQTQEVIWSVNARYALPLSNDKLLVYGAEATEILDFRTGEPISKFEKHIQSLANFSVVNQQEICCVDTDRMYAWDSDKGFSGHRELSIPGVSWAALFPDRERAVYSVRKGELAVRNLSSRNPTPAYSLLGHRGMVTNGCFTHNGKVLVTTSVDGTAKLWPTQAKENVAKTGLTHAKLSNICFDENGTNIYFVSRRVDIKRMDFTAGTIDLSDMSFSTEKIQTTYRAHWPRQDFSFSPKGKLLAAPVSEPVRPENIIGFCQMEEVGIWDCRTWERLGGIKTGFSEINAVAWNCDANLLAIAGQSENQASIKVFNRHSDEIQPLAELKFDSPVAEVEFHDSALAASTEKQLSVWDFDSEQVVFKKRFDHEIDGRIVCVDFSPDGNYLAVVDHQNDNLITLDSQSGDVRYETTGPRAFCSVCFSPCGKRLALSGYDGVVHLCDAESGNRLLTLPASDSLPGTDAINSNVIFSPDGKRIATNTWRGEIRFWEIN